MSATVPQELLQRLQDATSGARHVVKNMLEQCGKLPASGGGANPTMFAGSRRAAAVKKNTDVLTDCDGTLRAQAQQLGQTATKGLGFGQSGGAYEDEE